MPKPTVINTMAGKNYTKSTDRATEKMLIELGIIIEGDAISRVPVDSGRLRGSISYATQKTRPQVDGPATQEDGVSKPTDKWTLHVGTNVEYAPYVEYGAAGRPAQPYLRPAARNAERDVRAMGAEIMGDILRG